MYSSKLLTTTVLAALLLLGIPTPSLAGQGTKGVLFRFFNTTPYVLRVIQLGPSGENDASRQHFVPPGGNVAMNGNYNGMLVMDDFDDVRA